MPEFPDDLLAELRAVPAVAAVRGEPGVHAVGGAIRDLLLGQAPGARSRTSEPGPYGAPHDVDLVVEGDAVALARRIGLPVAAVHERFGTATWRLADGQAADLAGARTERYARPGALPDVELGASLAQDLERRDFTVNAMAVALDDGRMTSPPGALDDLRAGTLRVLHPRSFLDDPTRLLRGARYAARLGFEYDAVTAALAREAVEGRALATVTPARIGSELRLLLFEPQPEAVLRLPAGVLPPGAEPDAEFVARATALAPTDILAGRVALAAAADGVDADVLAARILELGLTRQEARWVGGPVVQAVLAAARGDRAARRWLDRDRHRTLAIDGNDLVAAGLSGPAVGRGLAAARAAMLDGSAPDRGTQLAAALASEP